MAKKKLIMITGYPCVGKSTIGRKVFERYENSAFCDGDWCWCVNPLSLSDSRVRNGDKNMAFLVSNYLNSDFEYVVFTSIVLSDPVVRESIMKYITAEDFEVISFQLVCSPDTLRARHKARGGSEEVSFFWLQFPPYPGEYEIDTDNKTPDEICDEICALIDQPKRNNEGAKKNKLTTTKTVKKKAETSEKPKTKKTATAATKKTDAKGKKTAKKA